jgi:transaldolase
MVQLSLRFAPYTIGYLHVQTNPKWAYSTLKTIKNAERILAHFRHIDTDFDTKRVCIKIPSTWEGLQACKELERHGITTLATTMFCMEQALLAADAGCTYIAPYVNELRVHFDPR